jgi:hypothetical protein
MALSLDFLKLNKNLDHLTQLTFDLGVTEGSRCYLSFWLIMLNPSTPQSSKSAQ